MTKLAVILGAGASYDCCSDSGPWKQGGKWKPPILSTLFGNGEFDEVLAGHPQAQTLMSDLRTRSTQFEQCLLEFTVSENQYIQRQLKFVPIALADFFEQVSHLYTTEAINYSALINRTIGQGIETAFITLNYDSLFDQSLERITGASLQTVHSYIESSDWLYLKAHGSVRWGYPWPSVGAGDLLFNALQYDAPPLSPSQIEVGLPSNYRSSYGLFYPALALPVPGKTTFVCPPVQLKAAEVFLAQCHNFLFIGFSAHDSHLLDLIAKATEIPGLGVKPCKFAIVARDRDLPGIRDRLSGTIPAFHATPGVLYSEHGQGFTDFLKNGINKFLGELL